VDTDEVQAVVLEIVECAEMEHNQNRHNLAVGHAGSTTVASLPVGGQKRPFLSIIFYGMRNLYNEYTTFL